MKKFIEESGLSLREFSNYYEIPYNTVREWKNGNRIAPKWVEKLFRENAKLKTKGTQMEIDIPDFYMIETADLSIINGIEINRSIYTNKEEAKDDKKFYERINKKINFYEIKIIKR